MSFSDQKLNWTNPTTGTHSHTNNTNEQDVFEVTGITGPTDVVALLDLVNLTQSTTVRAYEKPDGTNYRSVDPKKSWTTSDEAGLRIVFTAMTDYKITLQSGTGEGASRNVPYRHTRRVMG